MGWVSSLISRRTFRAWGLVAVLVVAMAALAGGIASGNTATCLNAAPPAQPTTLDGSAFEIDVDANLKVDNLNGSTGCIDWLNGSASDSPFRNGVVAKTDTASGSTDESFTQGTKEDTANPVIETGSIPPNKSDLKAFGVYTEQDEFLELFWTRVQDPSGTTNMDFELNQKFCDGTAANCADNLVTPERTVDDILITYDLSRGGTRATISIRKWTGTKWGDPVQISDQSEALGTINTSAIDTHFSGWPVNASGEPVNADGDPVGLRERLGSLSPRTFGEAAISFDALFGEGACGQFGSAYLKSRSSDSFTAALKDFVPPQRVDISNCPAGLTTTATSPVTIGSPISDTAHLDTGDTSPTGTITFHLFPSLADCEANTNEIDTNLDPVTVDGDGDYNSGDYTPTAVGSYFWTADYSGDATHDPVSTDCGEEGETSVVNKGPSSLSTAQDFLPNDSATITGAGTLGGSVTFKLYPSLADCTADTNSVYGPDTRTVSGTGSVTVNTQNTTFKINAANAGDYFWGVSYTGDSTHNGISRSCHENSDHTITNGGTVNSN